MNKTTNTTIRKRRGYLIPIEGAELEGKILRGWKYVPIDSVELDKITSSRGNRSRFIPSYYKKIKVWGCSYCGQESHFMAIFPHSGYETLERLCPKCVKLYGPVMDSSSNPNSVPVCNLL